MFREEKGLRQDDLASAAQEAGLAWSRSSIASLEAGSRGLSVEELAVLPIVLGRLGGWGQPLVPLDTKVLVGKSGYLEAAGLLGNLRALAVPTESADAESEDAEILRLGQFSPDDKKVSDYESLKATVLNFLVYHRIAEMVWPNAFHALGYHSSRDLEYKVAERLNRVDGRKVDVDLVAAASYGLWSRSLNDERDRRAAERGPYESPRALQAARGHVTRDLIEELQAEINARIAAIRECEAEVQGVIGSEAELDAWVQALRDRRWASAGLPAVEDKNDPSEQGDRKRKWRRG